MQRSVISLKFALSIVLIISQLFANLAHAGSFYDNFDNYSNSNLVDQSPWNGSNFISVGNTRSQSPTKSISRSGTTGGTRTITIRPVATSTSAFYVSFYAYVASTLYTCGVPNSAANHFQVLTKPANRTLFLSANDCDIWSNFHSGASAVAIFGQAVLIPDTWNYVEAFISSTNVTYRINGSSSVAYSLTGTPYSGQSGIDMGWSNGSGGGKVNIDGTTIYSDTNVMSTDISSSTTWSSDKPYVISGNISINSGKTLTIDPGVVVKFDTATSSSLTVDGNLIAVGSQSSKIHITSLNDDAVPAIGDTNSNSSSTIPAAGDWGGIVIGNNGFADLEFVTIRYGGSPATSGSMLLNNGGILYVLDSTVAYSDTYGVYNASGSTTIQGTDIGFNDYGLYLETGSASINSSSTIHDNGSYGIYNESTNTIDAQNVWWATSTGPLHPSSNPTGGGDEVSDYVDYSNRIMSRNYFLNSNCHAGPKCGSTPNSGILVWDWASTTTPVYTSLIDNAIDAWDNGSTTIDIFQATTSSMNVALYATSTDDVPWSGKWEPVGSVDAMYFNTYYLNQDTNAQRQHTMSHEFGHALGLDHSYTGNIMFYNQTSKTDLGAQDLFDIKTLWP